ncbi:regulator of chromosome condensation 1/beta-lactamase-inhibitor protein II [Collybia nuda]|uniref:Regulator of chromosome condensation 1/beta-lactamase-inhibitor protein II n=1 Tax=Collybia nuda TaxID=64659 RepID=A0A9P5YJC4_9AGAR|nr:regulator of chromosome condensation 1/beta-lactamase-inhibitor protein II [Collybia nuda]
MPLTSLLLSSGSNAHGQLSNGTSEDVHKFAPCSFLGYPTGTLPPGTRRVVHITSGANHTLALLETEAEGKRHLEIWGCGDGSSGQLGSVLQARRTASVFWPIDLSLKNAGLDNYSYKLVCASWETTYIVLSCEGKADVFISMGADDFGDLGVEGMNKGRGKQAILPFHIVSFDHLTLEGVPVRKDSITVESLVSGQHHVVVQLRGTLVNGKEVTFVAGWGTSRHGQLGNLVSPGGGPTPFLTKPAVISIDDSHDRIIAHALGSQHTVFLYASGKVSGLGSSRRGQLQGLENVKHATGLGCTWNGTYLLVNDGQGDTRVIAAGSYMHGQLGRELPVGTSGLAGTLKPSAVEFPGDTQSVKSIACGTEHVLAICTSKGTDRSPDVAVWGWGWNEHGNLGTGSTNNIFVPVKIWTGAEEDLIPVRVWGGSGTSWIYATHDADWVQ